MGISVGGAAAAPLPSGHTSEVQMAPRPLVPVRGPRYAAVTIDVGLVLPPTAQAIEVHPLLKRQLAAGDVRIVYHPLAGSGPWAMNELEALVEAAREERFVELVDALFARGPQPLSTEELLRAGREAGLVPSELAAALADHRHREEADRIVAATRAGNFAGRGPSDLSINGTRVWSRISERDLADRVQAERRRAEKVLASGVPLTRLYEALVREREEAAGGLGLGPPRDRRLAPSLAGAPTRGPQVAPVTIVLVSSFGCMQCAELADVARRLEARFPNRIRWVWKNLPTSPWATLAAEFGAAAHAQGRFWAFYGEAQRARFRIDRALLLTIARDAGLDVPRVEREVQAGIYRAEVQRDVDEAKRLGLTWPGFGIVDGQALPPGTDYATYERLVAKELDTGLLERLMAR